MAQLPLHPKTRRDGSITEPILKHAQVDDDLLEELIADGPWYFKEDNLHGRYHVSVGRNPRPTDNDSDYEKDSLVMLSHHILKISIKNFRVRYIDGDPLNCRRDNLEVKLDGNELMELRQCWLDQIKADIQLRMELPR